ncbi:MAG TPA: allantoinase AllB [Pyrinomonadaceae bacterium]
MNSSNLIIRGKRVVLPAGVAAAAIHIQDGQISEITSFDAPIGDSELVDADELVVMPGLVDTHVHINEPGRTEWEGFNTGTQSAAAGGTTTLVDMPLNSIPPTTSLAGLAKKLEAAKNKCYVDVGFWGGVVPGNATELEGMLAAGVVGFKCFLVASGVEEFPHVTEQDLRQTMPVLSRLGALLIVHAELPGPIAEAGTVGDAHSSPTKYDTFLCSRPAAAENEAVAMMIDLAREFKTAVHIVHLSSAEALPMLRDAQHSGIRISAETCPHYLYFAAQDIPSGATEFKCCPPIRERSNREELWRAVFDGTINSIVSDHSPCPVNLKLMGEGDFLGAWGGIASLQLRLPVIWSGAKRRGRSLEDLTRWLCYEPAKLVGLGKRKGMIAPGYDADVVIWDAEKEFRVNAAMLHQRHKTTPYKGETLIGTVQKTFLRGQKIYDDGSFPVGATGSLLLPN